MLPTVISALTRLPTASWCCVFNLWMGEHVKCSDSSQVLCGWEEYIFRGMKSKSYTPIRITAKYCGNTYTYVSRCQNSTPQLQLELVFTGPVCLYSSSHYKNRSWNTSANSHHQTRTYWAPECLTQLLWRMYAIAQSSSNVGCWRLNWAQTF